MHSNRFDHTLTVSKPFKVLNIRMAARLHTYWAIHIQFYCDFDICFSIFFWILFFTSIHWLYYSTLWSILATFVRHLIIIYRSECLYRMCVIVVVSVGGGIIFEIFFFCRCWPFSSLSIHLTSIFMSFSGECIVQSGKKQKKHHNFKHSFVILTLLSDSSVLLLFVFFFFIYLRVAVMVRSLYFYFISFLVIVAVVVSLFSFIFLYFFAINLYFQWMKWLYFFLFISSCSPLPAHHHDHHHKYNNNNVIRCITYTLYAIRITFSVVARYVCISIELNSRHVRWCRSTTTFCCFCCCFGWHFIGILFKSIIMGLFIIIIMCNKISVCILWSKLNIKLDARILVVDKIHELQNGIHVVCVLCSFFDGILMCQLLEWSESIAF